MFDQEIFEHEGMKFGVTFPYDDSSDTPWEREDGHGPVSGWKRHAFGMGSKPPKAPGERILIWDSGSYRTYDFVEAIKIAKRGGWDAEPYGGTPGQRAQRAVEADFKRLQDWCNGGAHGGWAGCVLSPSPEPAAADEQEESTNA